MNPLDSPHDVASPTSRAPAAQRGAVTAAESPRIGVRLRRARQARNLTINDVALAANLTKGFLSQVERDLASVSVASLVRLCDVLGINVGSLFDHPTASYVSREQRSRIDFGGKGVVEHLLTPGTETRLQVIEQVVEPGGGGGDEQYTLRSDAEFVHVLRGRLEIAIGAEAIELKEGDSLTFSAQQSHTWRNPSARQATHAIWVFTPALR